MKKYVSQKLAGVFTACVLSAFSAQTASAQVTLGYNTVLGNQSGTAGNFQIISSTGDGPYIHMFTNDNNSNSGNYAGSMNFIAGYSADANRPVFSFSMRDAPSNAGWQRRFEILQSGAVRIGGTGGFIPVPTTQSDYKLAVAGKIVGQSIYVTNPSTWADFVFESDYEPMALPSLESYLKKNKHLPYIPSAKEVEANGYNVAEMDAKLLQTVEELTLQVIALSKQVEQLKAANVTNQKN